MSHPNASVKSICSGKINLDSPDDIYFNNNSSYNYSISNQDIEDESYKTSGYEYIDDISSKESNYSVTSKNLKILDNNNQRVKFNDNNGTNLSLISTESDYQRILEDSNSLLSPDSFVVGDSLSRPISRSSTTSCLSTTATKDGIEGRKFHRYGPTAYSSNIIANMVHNQQKMSGVVAPVAATALTKDDTSRNSLDSNNTSIGDDNELDADLKKLKKRPPIRNKHQRSHLSQQSGDQESEKSEQSSTKDI
ncbi:hypothetical protein JA1_003022 [Spathaspora sp. JA1]|nr:hypothetical protein JA1_003022 [Spathaspora sp. JA1]